MLRCHQRSEPHAKPRPPAYTYTGAAFNSLEIDQQETILIHEMGHVYTNSGLIPDISSEYSYRNIISKCKTAMPSWKM